MIKKTKYFVIAIFIISVGLRLTLSYINRQANDDHISAIGWIVDKHEIPNKDDCLECFQPKFFYVVSAGIITLLHVHSSHRIITIQFFNAILGFFTLLFFWKFIKKQNFSELTKVLLFAFFAFNPRLTAINVQVTNDTLEILGGVMAVYFCDLFFSKMSLANFIFLVLSVCIAGLTKATGILLFLVIAIYFILKIFSAPDKVKRYLLSKYLVVAVLAFIGIVIFAGGYYSYYKTYNGLPSSRWTENPPAHFFKDTYVSRPGVLNLADGFFTFRYFDMIKQPYITNGDTAYPLHRTSLWSQLYGRTVFLHFDRWPPEWQTKAPLVIFIGRVLIIIGVVPLFLFLKGLYKGFTQALKRLLKQGRAFLAEDTNYLHVGITVAMLAVSVRYCYEFRDFSAMKAIYIFPGLISFIQLFLNGYKFLKRPVLIKLVNTILLTMIVLSITDIGHLIYQLSYRF